MSDSDDLGSESVQPSTKKAKSNYDTLLSHQCVISLWAGSDKVPRTELLANIAGKSALLCTINETIDKEVLDEAGDNLKVIVTFSGGYDNLDVNEIKKRNIRIGHCPVFTQSTGELTVALLLATSRRLIEANHAVKTGNWSAWKPDWMCGPGLANSTVGIVGFGRIGQEVARILKGFRPKTIIYHSRSEKAVEAQEIGALCVDFDELLSRSDFVLATCPLTPITKNLFNETAFRKMKKSAVFINTSRGDVVDQNALVHALKNNIIWGAGLDVTTPEPLPMDNELVNLKNCVIVPHIGTAAIGTHKAMGILCAQNIVCALNNEEMPGELVL